MPIFYTQKIAFDVKILPKCTCKVLQLQSLKKRLIFPKNINYFGIETSSVLFNNVLHFSLDLDETYLKFKAF